MTSSIKLEAYIALSSLMDWAAEMVTRKENFLKYRHAVFEISKQTDGQRDRHTDNTYFVPLPRAK